MEPKCWMINYIGFKACQGCSLAETKPNGTKRQPGFFIYSKGSYTHDCFLWQRYEFIKDNPRASYRYKLFSLPWLEEFEDLLKTLDKLELKEFLIERYYNGRLLDNQLHRRWAVRIM